MNDQPLSKPKNAIWTGLHTFRHALPHIRTVQELLGHKDVKTTLKYTHVLNRGPKVVRSPLDEVR